MLVLSVSSVGEVVKWGEKGGEKRGGEVDYVCNNPHLLHHCQHYQRPYHDHATIRKIL